MGVAMGKLIGYPATMWGDPIADASVLCEPGVASISIRPEQQSQTLIKYEILIPKFNKGMETEHKFCIIVGGGMCGIAVGAFLVKKNILPDEDFRLLDKLDDYGGVWQANHYPGAACDVVSHCYAMKFHLNPSNNTLDFRGLIR